MSKNYRERGIFGANLQKRSKGRAFRLAGTLEAVKATIPLEASVIDIAASHGKFTKKLVEAGYQAFGIDGTPGIEEISDGVVKEHDILDGGYENAADWGIFMNAGEHVARKYEYQLVKNVCAMARNSFFVAWADKVTPDRRAPNRRCDFYIASIFGIFGWLIDEEKTLAARELAGDYGTMNERILVMNKVDRHETLEI